MSLLGSKGVLAPLIPFCARFHGAGVFARTDWRGGGWQIYVDDQDNGNGGVSASRQAPSVS